jgi:hypothetical protein
MTDDSRDVEAVMASARVFGAQTVVFLELLGMLIEKGVLNQGDVIARYERLSAKLMSDPLGQEGVQLADIVRNFAAAEQGRKPS